MTNSKLLFDNSLQNALSLMVIYDYLQSIHAPFDYSDLLRWQWVEAVSAFDRLIHDCVLVGMLEIFRGTRAPTDKYNNEEISLSVINSLDSSSHTQTERELAFEFCIRQKMGFKAFQDPQKVADALSYIWTESDKWSAIGSCINRDARSIKTQLNNIVIRRNQIVHESDKANIAIGKQSITRQDTEEVLQFISDVGHAICSLVV